jgi:uncharacterized membrane protein (DUF441 family)
MKELVKELKDDLGVIIITVGIMLAIASGWIMYRVPCQICHDPKSTGILSGSVVALMIIYMTGECFYEYCLKPESERMEKWLAGYKMKEAAKA